MCRHVTQSPARTPMNSPIPIRTLKSVARHNQLSTTGPRLNAGLTDAPQLPCGDHGQRSKVPARLSLKAKTATQTSAKFQHPELRSLRVQSLQAATNTRRNWTIPPALCLKLETLMPKDPTSGIQIRPQAPSNPFEQGPANPEPRTRCGDSSSRSLHASMGWQCVAALSQGPIHGLRMLAKRSLYGKLKGPTAPALHTK